MFDSQNIKSIFRASYELVTKYAPKAPIQDDATAERLCADLATLRKAYGDGKYITALTDTVILPFLINPGAARSNDTPSDAGIAMPCPKCGNAGGMIEYDFHPWGLDDVSQHLYQGECSACGFSAKSSANPLTARQWFVEGLTRNPAFDPWRDAAHASRNEE